MTNRDICEKIVNRASKNAAYMEGIKIGEVPVALLKVDFSYQRAVTKSRHEKIHAMSKEYSPILAALLIVSYRPEMEAFYILDGQARYIAALQSGQTHVPCLIMTGLEITDEAKYFLAQDNYTTGISNHDYYKAGLLAGREACKKLNEIMVAHGIDNPRKIHGIKSALTLAEADPEALNWIFDVICGTDWGKMDGNNGFSRTTILSLYAVYRKHIRKDMPDSIEFLAKVMAMNSPTKFKNISELCMGKAKRVYQNVADAMSAIIENDERKIAKMKRHSMEFPVVEGAVVVAQA